MENRHIQTDLEFRNLSLGNFSQYLEAILALEEQFHPDLREDEESLTEILSSRGFVGKIACLYDECIGNTLGFSPTTEQIEEMGLLGIKNDSANVYLTNFVMGLPYQGQGLGTLLLDAFINETRQRGFRSLEGHFRNSTASLHLAKKLGAKELGVYQDWQGTGEEYTHCRINL